MTVIFDTNDYIEEDGIYIADDIGYLVDEYTRKTNGEVKGYVFLSERTSHYGAIGGNGLKGYKVSNVSKLGRAILNVAPSADRAVGSVSDDGELIVRYYDHDGTDNAVIKRIPKSIEERVDNLVHMGTHEEIISYVENMPTIKIKKSMQK